MVQDGGPDSRRYPNDVPNGFFTLANIGVDSIAAFTIAEAEARKARQGFDSCDYFLQKREFSSEAVWKLDLVDANHRLVGSVFISAANGQVYRTVWVKRDSISGFPVFTDSLSPRSKPFTGITDGNTLPPDPGFAGITAPPSTLQRPPFTPVSPEGTIRQAPGQNPESAPRNGSIFKEFPTEGGGSSRPTPNQPFNPLDPAPPVTEPAPVLRRTPVDPAITGPVPPIDVPDTGGSSERIPPPPVPR
jgi:hypothetical protein